MHDSFDSHNTQKENFRPEDIPGEEDELTEEDFDFEGEDESLYNDGDPDMNQGYTQSDTKIPLLWFDRSVQWILN